MNYTEFAEKMLLALYQESEAGQNNQFTFGDLVQTYGFEVKENWVTNLAEEWDRDGYARVSKHIGNPLDWRAEILAQGMREVEEKYSSKDGVGEVLPRVPHLESGFFVAEDGAPLLTEQGEKILLEGSASLGVAFAKPTASTVPVFLNPHQPNLTAPASDRIVLLSDNDPQRIAAAQALSELSSQLKVANDIGGFTNEEVEEARREIWVLEQAIGQASVRLDWIELLAKTSLKWIAAKAAEQIVGALALAALAAIATLIGFPV